LCNFEVKAISFVDFKNILDTEHAQCLHVSVGYDLIEMMDRVNSIDPSELITAKNEDDHQYSKGFPYIKELSFSMSRFFVIKPPEGTFAVLGIDRKGFVCHSCNYGRHSCSHVSCLTDVIKRNEEELPDFICELIAAHQELASRRIETFILKTASSGKVP